MPESYYSVRRTEDEGIVEFLIEVAREIHQRRVTVAGLRYLDGERIRMAAPLKLDEYPDASGKKRLLFCTN
jgi:hypothetical protein